MLRWFQALMPREERFFDLFEAHARTLCAGAHALRDLLAEGGEGVPGRCADIAIAGGRGGHATPDSCDWWNWSAIGGIDRLCPPKAKVTRSNRVGCAIFTYSTIR